MHLSNVINAQLDEDKSEWAFSNPKQKADSIVNSPYDFVVSNLHQSEGLMREARSIYIDLGDKAGQAAAEKWLGIVF